MTIFDHARKVRESDWERPARAEPQKGASDFTNTSYGVRTEAWGWAGVGTDGSSTTSVSWDSSSRNSLGIKTPGFFTVRNGQRKRLRGAELPINDYRLTVRECTGGTYSRYYVDHLWPLPHTLITMPACAVDTLYHPIDPELQAEVLKVAGARVRNQVKGQSANIALMFAERRSTAVMIADRATLIARAALQVRNGQWRHAIESLSGSTRYNPLSVRARERALQKLPPSKRLANAWLELEFGWKPLLSDVHGAATMLASRAASEQYNSRLSASFRKRVVKPSTWSGLYDYVNDHESKCKYVIRYFLDSESRQGLSQTGISDPLTLAWQVLPFSFVVDWFIPVGNYLSALGAYDGFTFRDGSLTTLDKVVTHKSYNKSTVNSGWWGTNVYQTSGEATFTEVNFRRSRITGWPIPAPPELRSPLDNGPLWKFATSMALLRQIF